MKIFSEKNKSAMETYNSSNLRSRKEVSVYGLKEE